MNLKAILYSDYYADLISWYFDILNIHRSNIVRWLQTTMQTGRTAVIMRWKHFNCIICHHHLYPSISIYLYISSSSISAVFLSWGENILAAFLAIIILFYPPCPIITIIFVINIIIIIFVIIRRAFDSRTGTWSWWGKKPSLLQKSCSRSQHRSWTFIRLLPAFLHSCLCRWGLVSALYICIMHRHQTE